MIVIKGAMPKSCWRCDIRCRLRLSVENGNKQRHPDCPIVGEIPDVHGDLIERSHILDKVKDEWRKIREEKGYDVMSDFWLALCKVIEEAPTVLEASK